MTLTELATILGNSPLDNADILAASLSRSY